MNPAKPLKLDPNKIKTRNYLMVRLINGATKGGIEKDHRKEANKRSCRDWRRGDE